MKRRDSIKAIGAAAVGAAAAVSLNLHAEPAPPKAPEVKLPEAAADEDILITMQRDLQWALKKPIKDRKWSMTIDLRKCIGCHACTVGCMSENKLPPGVIYRPVQEEEVVKGPKLAIEFLPRPCMQCENPPCAKACPVKATWKGDDGIVRIDYDKCIGCRYCVATCPYGARSFDAGRFYTDGTPRREAYEMAPAFEYGKKWEKKTHFSSPIGNARKCHFCLNRLEAGMLPTCVTTCVGRATYFGDMADPESLIAKITAQSKAWKLREELGTKPTVTYIR